jgi:hypothetical protein
MRHLRVLICSVDAQTPAEMTERAAFDLPTTDVTALPPETALADLAATPQETGNASLQRVLHAQGETIDPAWAEQPRPRFFP